MLEHVRDRFCDDEVGRERPGVADQGQVADGQDERDGGGRLHRRERGGQSVVEQDRTDALGDPAQLVDGGLELCNGRIDLGGLIGRQAFLEES